MNRWLSFCLAAVYFLCADISRADTFGSGVNTFSIDFVTIGNPGNPPDANPNPAGAVPYEYRIGKYEISEQMIDKANALGGLGITKDARGPDYPATSVTWYEAAKFVNWLNTSARAVRPLTSLTAAVTFSYGRLRMLVTTRTISIAIVSPSIFCQASTSGTRRRTTILVIVCTSRIQQGATTFQTELIFQAMRTSKRFSTTAA
jgi:hypothetical protein